MSEFSDKCRLYLNETGCNVYQIAHAADLDRTTIQRMLTGKRLPSTEFVKSFCNHLRINPMERKELMDAYNIERIGKTTYQNRRYIQMLLEHISNANLPSSGMFAAHAHTCLPTTSLLIEVVRRTFQAPGPQIILTNIPASHEFFYLELKKLHEEFGKCIPVKHVFSMHPNPVGVSNANINLEKLYHIIPFLFSKYENYTPYYYYSRNLDSDYATQLFPYYVITPSEVLLLSADMRDFLRFEDSEAISKYTNLFHSLFGVSMPLIKDMSNGQDAMTYYNGITQRYGLPTLTLESMPCVHSFLSSPDILPRLCPEDMPARDFLIESARQAYDAYYRQLDNSIEVSTISGIRQFALDGRLSGASTIYSDPFEKEERREMLDYFLGLCRAQRPLYVMDDSLQIDRDLQIEVYGKHLLHIISSKYSSFRFLAFTESSICEAFEDFVTALSESESLLTPDQAEAEVRRVMGS